MRPTLRDPPVFRMGGYDKCRISLVSDAGYSIEIFVLEPDIVRVLHAPAGGLAASRTWSIAPGAEDVPSDGRDRFDIAGFSPPDFSLEQEDERLILTTACLRLTVTLKGPFFVWQMKRGTEWVAMARDRPTQAYNFGYWRAGPRHYLVRRDGERYFGLGEKSGALDRAGRRLRLTNLDAMGYNARTSDPLYKHIPFYITHNAKTGAAFGLFYDTVADCAFDFGAEHSNYHGPYRSFEAEAGDLDYYVIAGPQVESVTRRFTWLTGRPALMPRWSFGYSGSTMAYTDAPDAQAQMHGFIDQCRRHDILCDSFHLSSGYTSIGPRRYVFNWNREKFPDPAAFAASYRDAGVRLVANIKPCLLEDHPLFAEARAKGLLVGDEAGEPTWCQFWDGVGAYLDFTNPDTQTWWRAHVSADLLAFGVAATWNDNNEFEIEAPDARAFLFGQRGSAADCKPLQTLLMQRASREAQRAFAPGQRPFLVSRAGGAGMQRYVQTWSGDNCTSWETLRYNIRMGLGLALSGVSNSGHDIGGFAGAKPDAELLMRWVEAGVFMPRFSIHSWNSGDEVTEPWMYPETTPVIRGLIKLRAELAPYVYDLHWRNCMDYTPITRPAFYDFPDDPLTFADTDDLMLGASLLVASVVEPGADRRAIYLPAGVHWRDFWTGERFEGGAVIVRPALPGKPPLLVREGAGLPLNIAAQSFDRRVNERAFALFAPPTGRFEAFCHEDDGETEAWREGRVGRWRVSVDAGNQVLDVACFGEGETPPSGPIKILLRPGDQRRVRIDGVQASEIALETASGVWRAFALV